MKNLHEAIPSYRACPDCGTDVLKHGSIGGYVRGKPTLVCICGKRLTLTDDKKSFIVWNGTPDWTPFELSGGK
jgi:hypothetical protein